MARSKATALQYPVGNEDDANAAVRRIAAAQLALETIDTGLKAATAELKAKAEAEAQPLKQELKGRLAGLQAWAEAHRAELTRQGRRQSLAIAAGRIGWRKRPPSVSIRGAREVLEAIRAGGRRFRAFLRVKYEINKDAMLEKPELAASIDGVSIRQGEEFFVEPAALDLAEGTD